MDDRFEPCLVVVAPLLGLLVWSLMGSELDDPVGYAANSLDLNLDHIAVVQEHGWFPGDPDALRCAGSDEVARPERHCA